MPAVTKKQALKFLSAEVKRFDPDELLEVHNELFPDDPSTAEEAHEDSGPLIKRLTGHINSGLGIDQIIDLWGLIFPRHWDVWYNEEEDRFYYEEAEAVPTE